jgi:hypothetical protein
LEVGFKGLPANEGPATGITSRTVQRIFATIFRPLEMIFSVLGDCIWWFAAGQQRETFTPQWEGIFWPWKKTEGLV